jgi:hypothetical protein
MSVEAFVVVDPYRFGISESVLLMRWHVISFVKYAGEEALKVLLRPGRPIRCPNRRDLPRR